MVVSSILPSSAPSLSAGLTCLRVRPALSPGHPHVLRRLRLFLGLPVHANFVEVGTFLERVVVHGRGTDHVEEGLRVDKLLRED